MRGMKTSGGSGDRHRTVRAASLLEAIVAAAVLLIVFGATLDMLPRITLHTDDVMDIAEAEYRVGCAFEKYSSGLWPQGTYVERYDAGEITVRVEPYRDCGRVQIITVAADIRSSRKRIVHKQIVECRE
ncbi:hypothetical protein [uncultured Alistipes sp.]|uniref:hypothetical protein n=1 Tax=uncultured Alistipes sp. TaxID=538949 RepID=UPI0026312D5E|nr:hypothetical protein [uncultured Alistipes sp.]